ncbi:MAG TPA: hypothetical protein VFB72_03890 [Verrucomicrobiae bacterium]|nr:hypothetical protein [Verrucomicrobiae bacterium]
MEECQFGHFGALVFHGEGAFETGGPLRRFALRQCFANVLDAMIERSRFDGFAVEHRRVFGFLEKRLARKTCCRYRSQTQANVREQKETKKCEIGGPIKDVFGLGKHVYAIPFSALVFCNMARLPDIASLENQGLHLRAALLFSTVRPRKNGDEMTQLMN